MRGDGRPGATVTLARTEMWHVVLGACISAAVFGSFPSPWYGRVLAAGFGFVLYPGLLAIGGYFGRVRVDDSAIYLDTLTGRHRVAWTDLDHATIGVYRSSYSAPLSITLAPKGEPYDAPGPNWPYRGSVGSLRLRRARRQAQAIAACLEAHGIPCRTTGVTDPAGDPAA